MALKFWALITKKILMLLSEIGTVRETTDWED